MEPNNPIRVSVQAMLQDLIPDYLANRQQDIIAISEALEHSKADPTHWEAIYTIGHSMKGSGGGYGFPAITEFGREIEKSGKARNGDEIQKQISELADYLNRLEVVYE